MNNLEIFGGKMELTKEQIKETKGIAILFMLLLHLFCTKDYSGLFEPVIYIGKYPLIYYIALFGDCCVAIYCFCSGYGLMHNYMKDSINYSRKNFKRVLNLYINYWIIIAVFVLGIGTILGKEGYPGNLTKLFLTVSGISPSYNGAWWFFTIYVILILLSKKVNKMILENNSLVIVSLSLIFYFAAYIQRIKVPLVVENEYMNYILRQGSLFGTSQFPFVMGGIFLKEKIYSSLNKKMAGIKNKNISLSILIIGMLIFHGLVETMFIAVFTGIIFICCFNLIAKGAAAKKIFSYFGCHSTNLWLMHMFFYGIFLKKLIYTPKYPILIFLWLIIICLPFSYFVNYLKTFFEFDKKEECQIKKT